jgi:tyrosyl-tRNA synthetase
VITQSDYQSCANVTDLLSVATGSVVFPSKGEARKMIQGGGVGINKSKIQDANQKPDFKLLQNKYLLAQKGKKNYFLIVVE